ncbi:MAG: beta-lactamase family protein [Verrucomicrobia bacterium]|nr:beta-lactamase family protein [Verrucomicrobiota bacterium]
MNFEDFQKSWQSQDAGRSVSINADALLIEVRRKQLCFRRTIFWRDVREIGVAALLVPVFIYGGWETHWTLYLCAFACLVVGADMWLDRWRQKKKTPDLHGSLKDCTATSLAEVSHQIWLLKNILWWYLLPLFVPIMLFCGCVAWSVPGPVADKILSLLPLIGFVLAVDIGVYWLNQVAVRKVLEPRRQELEKLLAGLETENHPSIMKTKKPLGPLLLVLAVSAIAVIVHAATNATKANPGTGLEAIRKKHNVPALAVIATKDGQICDRAAAGVRKHGDPTPITTNDVVHIGSCTKSMTATLAAILIEQGKLRWDTTIAEVFPELKGKMVKQYETVTVEQLLHHRGGVPGAPPSAAWKRAWQEIGTPREQRREFIEAVLRAPPAAAPGQRKIYSNQGYTIAGAMLEKISGQDFESLMTEKLFVPLGMHTAGFGPPGTKDRIDQPWGHVRKLSRTLPMQSDNPPAISPAGRVHCSLDDLARYAMFHLQRGTNGLLQPETMARLHAPPEGVEIKSVMDNYAGGWVRMKRSWAGGPVLWHNGSNTMWYMVMWLAPEKNFCVIAVTNIAGDDAEKACDDAAVMMIKKWLPE